MKNKSARIIVALLLVALSVAAFALTACGRQEKVIKLTDLTLPEAGETQMTVVVKNAEEGYTAYVVNLDGGINLESSVLDVLVYLKETHGMNFKYSEGQYGAYIEEVGELANNEAAGEYIMLYTSVEKDFDVSAYVSVYDCDGVTVKTSGLGCSDMSVQYGCVIYVQTIIYG